ncbi:hypothetical protein EL84_24250 [Paenibacillus sp. VT-400]|uniref:hypothetical protein n=1 Tax=Paenibacillus sp. VT-400 TaxID=1495853 RepID=UPI00064B6C95|nr:hypothetical protein [Paenibacillus sp. VT-400]KLU55181.1 hypothetical protein EL84_24250 [Paenibacillus sp. VT-400]
MKKFLVALSLGVLVATGLSVSDNSSFATKVEAKELVYTVNLQPNGTYQLGYGSGYKYKVITSTSSDGTPDITVSSSGLLKLASSPINVGVAGYVYVIDRYGDVIEEVTVQIKY